jgi:glycosyltransferase involved in cell wall biosynthesis
MRRVTFLTGEYPPLQGGIGDYTAHLAQALTPLNVKSSILISQVYPQVEVQATPGVTVYPAISHWGWRSWAEIKAFLVQYPTDILHIQYQAAAFNLKGWVNWLPWISRFWPQPPKIVTTFHDLRIPYLFPKAGPLRWQSILAQARFSDAVICTNPADVATLRRSRWATPYPWVGHIHEIPLGNNVAVAPPPGYDRTAWRTALGIGPQGVVLAYFGFLNESKGGEDLIAVLDQLCRQGIDAYLLMIGGDIGDSDPSNVAYAQRVKAAIAARNLSERIIFTGYVDLAAVSANMLAADLAVMPYRDGVSFRRTTLIALLKHGLPIISTHPPSPLPQITDGVNMLLAAPGDVTGLTQQALRVADDPPLRQRLQAGAIALSQPFDWSTVAAATNRVYESLFV